MKIVAFTKYSYEGPSSRYRFYNYKKCLEKNGIELDIKPLFKKEYFLSKNRLKKSLIALKSYLKRIKDIFVIAKIKKYDLVLIEYELFPYFPPIFEKMLHNKNIKYIVDYDDAIFHKYDMHKSFILRSLLKNKIPKVIKNATKVICCNNYLKNFAFKYNKNIEILHTVVLLDKYIEKQKKFIKQENSSFIIGWIGSKSTSIYILDIIKDLNKILSKYKDIKLHLVGFDKSLLKESKQIKIIKWDEKSEVDEILKFDIGIMPLRNEPWSKGKCGFKIIQYMSCKKPVVASPVGINCEIVENGKNGYLASSNEWFNILERLYLERDQNIKMGNQGFKKVLHDFNYNKNCEKYTLIIKELLCAQ